MKFELLATASPALKPQLHWLFYSRRSAAFITGDDRAAFALPVSDPGAMAPVRPAAEDDALPPPGHPSSLPIPASLYEEMAAEPWHGFRLLERSAYDRAVDEAGHPVGDLLRTLVFGPDYGHYLLHPSSGLVLSLRSGSLALLRRSADRFEPIDTTKTRGRAALAFAAHPGETLIAYGDNYGAFHAHRFDASGFGKASKIADKERKASRLEFTRAGKELVIGGMGYLAAFACQGGKFVPAHEVSLAVRDFTVIEDEGPGGGELVLVNGGLQGVSAYRHDGKGFTRLGEMQPAGAVQQLAVSSCRRYLAVSMQDTAAVGVYRMSPP